MFVPIFFAFKRSAENGFQKIASTHFISPVFWLKTLIFFLSTRKETEKNVTPYRRALQYSSERDVSYACSPSPASNRENRIFILIRLVTRLVCSIHWLEVWTKRILACVAGNNMLCAVIANWIWYTLQFHCSTMRILNSTLNRELTCSWLPQMQSKPKQHNILNWLHQIQFDIRPKKTS